MQNINLANRLFLIIWVLVVTVSCSNLSVDESSKESGIQNTLIKEIKKEDTSIKLFLIPLDKIIAFNTQGLDGKAKDSLSNILRAEYNNTMPFLLEISYKGKSLDWLEGKKIPANRLTYNMESYFKLEDESGKDIPLLNWHYASAPGLSPTSQFYLTYEFAKVNKTLNFTLKEFGIDSGDIDIQIPLNN